MKMKALVCWVVFIVVVLAGMCSFADDKEKFRFYVPNQKEEISGTWVNTNYSGISPMFQKLVSYNWGYYEIFFNESDTAPSIKGTIVLVDKWTDSEGNIWYKLYFRENMESYFVRFMLAKISENGSVWEFVHSTSDFPTEDDLKLKRKSKAYHIYYRQ